MLEAIHSALQVYRDRPTWERLMLRGMAADFSWDRSAREYLNVYQNQIAKKKC
jgi:starch synthase